MNIDVPAQSPPPQHSPDVPPDATKVPREILLPPDVTDKTTWEIVPRDDDLIVPPNPKPPNRNKATPPTLLPRPPILRAPKYPQGFHPDNDITVFPETGKTDGIKPTPSLPPQWIVDALVLGYTKDNLNPPFNQRNDVPIYPPTSPGFGVPMNLIIRIVPPLPPAKQDTVRKLHIFSIDVDIPLGTGPKELMTKYEGSGGTMINNQRWNVHVALFNDKVTFSLIPQSTTKLSALSRNEDLTFAIWGIVPNGVPNPAKGTDTQVTISVKENYRTWDRQFNNPAGKAYKIRAVSTAELRKVKL